MNSETEAGEAYECEGHSIDTETDARIGPFRSCDIATAEDRQTTISTYLLRTREVGLIWAGRCRLGLTRTLFCSVACSIVAASAPGHARALLGQDRQ